jgi:hypothetical protein
MASGPQHRDQPTTSQPPNDPMGFGGDERKAGYGKYHPGGKDNQEAGGVPGAFGDSQDLPEASGDIAKGDEVTEEMGLNYAAETAGSHPADDSDASKKAA